MLARIYLVSQPAATLDSLCRRPTHTSSRWFRDGLSFMSTSTPNTPGPSSSADTNALPQHGFGSEVAFDRLLSANPFLYRVYTPRSTPPQDGSAEPYFVGSKFDNKESADAFQSSTAFSTSASSASTYDDVVQHMSWTTRAASPFISTSFSFAWAIWEAIRRYHTGIKHNVEIAVIDARAVADRSITATELLMKASPQE